MTKLHEDEYIIDKKANDIPYDNTMSISQALAKALSDWEGINSVVLVPSSIAATYAFMVITFAKVHGVVIEKRDLRRTIKETERLVEKCEDEKEKLEQINQKLVKDLSLCNLRNEMLKRKLGEKDSEIGDV
jgi:hypothetical protein